MFTGTTTQTNTAVYARHIAAKVSADLKRLQRLYGIGSPSDQEIDACEEEMLKLLEYGYLGTVTYGYRRQGKWLVALKYRAIGSGVIGSDPGGIRRERDISNSHFDSFLIYSKQWGYLSSQDREQFARFLSMQRVESKEPEIENGHWVEGRSYAAGDLGVRRSMIQTC